MNDVYFAELRAQLDVELRDADNFTFTIAEKDEALRKAIEEDPAVFSATVDSDTLTVSSQSAYEHDFDELLGIGLDYYGNGYVTELPRSCWEDYGDGQFRFSAEYQYLPAGKALHLYGVKHLSKNDPIPASLRGYIMATAIVNTMDMLQLGKVNRFLRNDTTMGDMQMVRQNNMQEASRLRRTLRNRRAVRF